MNDKENEDTLKIEDVPIEVRLFAKMINHIYGIAYIVRTDKKRTVGEWVYRVYFPFKKKLYYIEQHPKYPMWGDITEDKEFTKILNEEEK